GGTRPPDRDSRPRPSRSRSSLPSLPPHHTSHVTLHRRPPSSCHFQPSHYRRPCFVILSEATDLAREWPPPILRLGRSCRTRLRSGGQRTHDLDTIPPGIRARSR